MTLELEESKKLCDWLMERGLGLGECAWVLMDLASGDSLGQALHKVFKHRKEMMEAINEKANYALWDCPITP